MKNSVATRHSIPLTAFCVVAIITISALKYHAVKQEGLIETLLSGNKLVYSNVVQWKGLDSRNKLPLAKTREDITIQWEGFLYLSWPQTFQVSALTNSECEITLDNEAVFKASKMPLYPFPKWKWKSNKLVEGYKAWDRNPETRATTKKMREGGEWLRIDLGSIKTILGITLDTSLSPEDFSKKLEILISKKKKFFRHIRDVLPANGNPTDDFFFTPVKARYIKLVNRDRFKNWWSIHELYVYTTSEVFKDCRPIHLEQGNHRIQIKFVTKDTERALCKIFIKNNRVIGLDKQRIYKERAAYIVDFINRFFWILIIAPVITLFNLLKSRLKYHPVCLFGALSFFFFLYLFSLTPNQNIFSQDANMFYTDNTEAAYMIQNLRGSYEGKGWNDTKHNLLFPVITWPLYKLGQIIFHYTNTASINLKIVFPLAFLGTINILLVFFILKRIIKKDSLSLLFSIIYGVFFGTWLYASFPEKYITNILFINILTFIALKYLDKIHKTKFLVIFSVIIAIGILIALHLSLMVLIPLFYLFAKRRTPLFLKSILYLSIIFFIAITAYEIAGRINIEFRFPQIIKYVRDYQATWGSSTLKNFINPKAVLSIIFNYFFYSVGIVYISPWRTGELSYITTYGNTVCGISFFLSYIVFVSVSLLGLKKKDVKEKWFGIFIFWIFLNILYFLYFNPREAFLYGPLIHSAWIVILAAGYNNSGFKYKKPILWAFILSLFLNNLQYMAILRHITLY